MIKALTELQHFIQYELQPRKLLMEQVDQAEEKWNKVWILQSEEIQHCLIFSHQPSENSLFAEVLTDLTGLSNQGYLYLTRYASLWKDQPGAANIRRLYQDVINRVNKLFETVAAYNKASLAEVPYSFLDLPSIVQRMKIQFNNLESHLSAATIEPELNTIILKALFSFIRNRNLSRRHVLYFDHLFEILASQPELTTEIVKDRLYAINFNQPEFFMYWIKGFERLLLDESDLHEQLEILIRAQDHLQSLRKELKLHFLDKEEPISIELKQYLMEKKETINQLIQLRRDRARDAEISKLASRVKINLPVAQLALFIRLQLEKGILIKENIGKTFSFYAAHFYTPQTENISPESLQKKSTDIEYATAQKLKAILISMINWLNENFKLSDS